MIEQFATWIEGKQGEIEHVSSLLATQLNSEPSGLIEDLTAVEAWNSRVGELLANATAYLDKAKKFYMPDRSEGSVEDRKIVMEAKVADIQRVCAILESLSDSIKQRLILGESILRFEKIVAPIELKKGQSPW